jgi:hypothetical protein
MFDDKKRSKSTMNVTYTILISSVNIFTRIVHIRLGVCLTLLKDEKYLKSIDIFRVG